MTRNLLALLFLCCAAGWALPLSAASPNTPNSTKPMPAWTTEQLMTTLSGVSGGTTRFVEKKYLGMLNEPLVLKGTLTYTAPSRLEKHVLSPYDERYTVDDINLQIDNPGKNIHRSFALQSYPAIWAFVESFRATLAGDIKTLQRFYTVSLNGDQKKWELTLLPLEPSMLKAITAIRIKGHGEHITSIEIQENNGDRSLMSLEDTP